MKVDDTRPRGVTLGPVTLTALSLIALQLVVRLVIVPQAYWWEDDFFHLAQARTRGLDPHLIVSDYNDHLEILPNLFFWLVSKLTDSSWGPAVVLIMLLSTAASVAVLALLRELFGDRPAILVPFAAYLFSPLLLVPVTWLSVAVEEFPMHAAMCGMAVGVLRLRRTGRIRWFVLAVVMLVLAVLTWEKGVLALPFVLGLQVLVADAGRPVRERLTSLRRYWWSWLTYVAVVAGFAALYLTVVDGSERKAVHGVDYVAAARKTFFEVLVPGLFGAPWHRGNALNTLYPSPGTPLVIASVVLLAGFVAVTIVRNRGAAVSAWLLALAYVGVDIGLLLWGRAGFLELVARDPRYLSDGVPVVLVCATAAYLGPGGERRPLVTWRALAPTAAVVAVLTIAGLLTTFQLVPVLRHDVSRSYVQGVLARADPDPGTSIVDTPLPAQVSGNVDHRNLLIAMGRHPTLNQPSTRMLAFDADARLVPVTIPFPVLQQTGPRKDCGWPVHDSPVGIGTVPAGTPPGQVLRLGTLSGVAGTLTARIGDVEQAVVLAPGLNAVYFHFDETAGDVVVSFDADGDGGACVTDLLLGPPAPGP